MPNPGITRAARAAFLILGIAAVAAACGEKIVVKAPLPDRLSDAEYWGLIEEFSEPDGYFRSDNFVSNERMFQYVLADLKATLKPGGVYLGVGPDQNYTYIIGLQPKLAFIVDIRRQNMMHHLMYKSLIELSADRAEFLSKLFSRPRPPGLDTSTSIDEMFDAYAVVEAHADQFMATLNAIKAHLTETHGFPLSESDLRSIHYVFSAFMGGGPDITYSYPNSGRGGGGFGGRGMPTYAFIQSQTDDGDGVNRAYLATEENFRALKAIHERNAIVPVVGDFAGKKALRSVGRYLREHGAIVSAYYTSNVEQYLFQDSENWQRFFENVATLPVDEKSTFIRALAQGGGRGGRASGRRQTMLDPIADEVRAYQAGQIRRYSDVIDRSR